LPPFQIAVETNGTLAAPLGLDWICVSPKAARRGCCAAAMSSSGYPQPGLMPQDIERDGAGADFRHWWLQPMDGPELSREHAARGGALPERAALAAEPSNPQFIGIA